MLKQIIVPDIRYRLFSQFDMVMECQLKKHLCIRLFVPRVRFAVKLQPTGAPSGETPIVSPAPVK